MTLRTKEYLDANLVIWFIFKEAQLNNNMSVEEQGADKEDQADPKAPTNSLMTLRTKEYLDATVVPVVLRGMAELLKERPVDPVRWLGMWLYMNADKAHLCNAAASDS